MLGDLERNDGIGDLEVIACADLTPDRRTTIDEAIGPHGDAVRDRIKRSWIWVDYVAVLLGRSAATWLLRGDASDISARNMSVSVSREGFEEFFLHEEPPRLQPSPTDAEHLEAGRQLLRWGIDEHASPIVRWASSATGVGVRTIWGSVASSIVHLTGVAAGALEREMPVEQLRWLLESRPELAGKGSFVRVGGHGSRSSVGFHRSTCCLWFRVDPGQMCGNCVLSSREQVEADVRLNAATTEPA